MTLLKTALNNIGTIIIISEKTTQNDLPYYLSSVLQKKLEIT